MAIQLHIENRSTLVRFLYQVTWVETPVFKSPQSFSWDVEEVHGFRDSFAGKTSGREVPCLAELAPRKLGAWKGKVWLAPDFDDDQETIELFEGSKFLQDGDGDD